MPAPKIAFKTTVLDLELDNVELTVGPEVMRVGHLKASVDVADLLRVQLPELLKDNAAGVMFHDFGMKKIQCIKEVRALTGWALREAKAFVESAPVLLLTEDIEMPGWSTSDKTQEAVRKLRGAGALVDVQQGTERIPTVLDKFREMLVEALGNKVSEDSAEE
jgi:ribosomal protein L7/L12